MNNTDVRNHAKENGVKFWEIAEKYGLHEGNFSRLLRHELPVAEKEKIIGIIDTIAVERGQSDA